MQQAQTAATLLQDLGQFAEAERIWRQYGHVYPHAVIYLARCVGLYGDLDEAFSLLDTAAKYDPPEKILLVGLDILRTRKTDAQDKHFSQLGNWYTAARGEPWRRATRVDHRRHVGNPGRTG